MNIGLVSTWLERGASYVTKSYLDVLKENHNVFIYARGGEKFEKGNPNWDFDFVTWGLNLYDDRISINHISKWIISNNLDIVFFNEQQNYEIVEEIRVKFPNLILGSYIDYYKENTISTFLNYDFLICNTQRHLSIFKDHPQVFYVPWGTNIDLFKPKPKKQDSEITFFHSVGMSLRKGTDILLDSYINNELYKNSKLIIHSQLDFEKYFKLNKNDLSKYKIELIEETVSAPGLYHLGDVYVYPTRLDGLGLTMYEALACGLPVITTDNAPMNEVINNDVGKLVKVEKYYARSDGYYWPLSEVSKKELAESMSYYIQNFHEIEEFKNRAREVAVNKWNWADRSNQINDIFESVTKSNYNTQKLKHKKGRFRGFYRPTMDFIPPQIENLFNNIFKKR